jgi:hypothetical protein
MSRVQISDFAPTLGHASSTYIADAESAEETLETALSEHDLVFIRSGTYDVSDTFSAVSGKTILGQPGSPPTLKMAAGTNKTVISNANAGSGGMTTDVVMRSLIIDQQGELQAGGGGIVVTGIQDWTLSDITIKKSYRFNFLSLSQAVGVPNNTGTVTVTKGSPTATGTGTLFTAELAVGVIIRTAGIQLGRVESIECDTSLTLTLSWGSATETGVTYKTIEPNSGCHFTRMKYEGTVDSADASGYGVFDNGIVEDSEAFGASEAGCGFVPDHARNMLFDNIVGHDNANSGVSMETGEDCIVRNYHMYANGNGLQLISGTSRCTVEDGSSHNNVSHGHVVTYNTTVAGIPLDNTFANATGYLNGGYAFRNDGALNTEFDNVTGYNNNTGGLILNSSNDSVPDNVYIHDSDFYDDRGEAKSQDRGIWIVAGTDTIVEDNTALDSLHVIAGIVDEGTNTTLSGNTT